MPVWISMLRGVNVGGKNKLPMERLRALYEEAGLKRAQTFIQSGNVVFESGLTAKGALAEKIEAAIEREFGFRPAVILRDTAELRKVVASNPFASRADVAPNKLLVTFLKSDPGEDGRTAVRAIETEPEEVFIEGSELFIYYPLGSGQSKLPAARIDRAHKMVGTSRNWNSVLKLLDLAEQRSVRS